MKKILSLILLALLPLVSNAYDAEINGIYYNFNGDEAEVTYGSLDYTGSVVIPSSVTYNGKTYRVTAIGWSAFSGCSNLTSVTLPKSLTLYLGEHSFDGCTSLKHIDLTSSLAAIYYCSFSGCTALETVVLPPTVVYLGGSVFSGCTSLKSITIPGGVTEIGYYAFSGCTSLKDVVFEAGEGKIALESPQSYLFDRCPLDSVYLGRSLLYKGNHGGSIDENYVIKPFPSCLKKLCLGANALLDKTSFSNVTSLAHIYPMWEDPTTFSRDRFSNSTYSNAILHVPGGTIENYQATEAWKDFTNIVQMPMDPDYIAPNPDGYYEIANSKQLAWFTAFVKNRKNDANAVLIADIDLSDISNTWMPIGSIYNPYKGFFDGQGHNLTGFTMEAASGDRMGLFGNVKDASIKNFSIDGNITFYGGNDVGVVGWSEGSTIRNVHSSLNIAVVEENSHHIGGICGSLRKGSTASGCSFSGTITETVGNHDCFGGIAGYCNEYCLYENCANYGTITFSAPNTYAGGICGYVNNDDFYGIKNCLNVGKVQMNNNGTPDYCGAIIGRLRTHANSVFENNYWLDGSALQAFGQATDVMATSVTTEQLTRGEICYALNGDQIEINWYQTLGEDNFPVLDSNHLRVWFVDGSYINPHVYAINDDMTSFNVATKGIGETVTFTHEFNGEWEPLYLPIAIEYEAIKDNFELAEIDGIVQNDDNGDGIADITVLSIIGFKGQATEPNTPYLIRAKNAGEQTIIFNDVTVYPTEEATFDCSSFSTRYEFTGSYNTLNAETLANCYVIQDGELVKGAASLAPCRWYMTATARNGAALNLPNKIRVMMVEDVIDGVSSFLNSPEEVEQVYNLAGQRLVNRQLQNGINIIRNSNGFTKKVLMK